LVKNPTILCQGLPFFGLFDAFWGDLEEESGNSLLRSVVDLEGKAQKGGASPWVKLAQLF
jgi:hypothetical protein